MSLKQSVCALTLAALAMAACGNGDPVAEGADDAEALPAPPMVNGSDPSGAPPPASSSVVQPADGASPPPAALLPPFLHGRWGLTPADCTSTRGDAKGLLAISADGLRFYESRAVPVANVNRSEDSFSAEFAFTGEGMRWIRFQTLELQEDKLVRTESNPTTSYTYARCD